VSKKSSTPKKVKESEDEGETVTFYFQHNADRTQCMVTLISSIPISGTDEVLAALQCFVDDCVKDETTLFEGADIPAGDGLLQ
jgi:hypothetical protein